jgi:hypothetical protein
MHLSILFVSHVQPNLSIRRHHKKSPAVWKQRCCLPHNTDTLNQSSECLYSVTITVNFKFAFHHTCYLLHRRWHYVTSLIVKLLNVFHHYSHLNNRYLKLFVVAAYIPLKAKRHKGAGYCRRVDYVARGRFHPLALLINLE